MMARPVRRASRGPAPRPRRASDSMVKRGRRGALGSRAALYGAMGGAAGRGRRLRPGARRLLRARCRLRKVRAAGWPEGTVGSRREARPEKGRRRSRPGPGEARPPLPPPPQREWNSPPRRGLRRRAPPPWGRGEGGVRGRARPRRGGALPTRLPALLPPPVRGPARRRRPGGRQWRLRTSGPPSAAAGCGAVAVPVAGSRSGSAGKWRGREGPVAGAGGHPPLAPRYPPCGRRRRPRNRRRSRGLRRSVRNRARAPAVPRPEPSGQPGGRKPLRKATPAPRPASPAEGLAEGSASSRPQAWWGRGRGEPREQEGSPQHVRGRVRGARRTGSPWRAAGCASCARLGLGAATEKSPGGVVTGDAWRARVCILRLLACLVPFAGNRFLRVGFTETRERSPGKETTASFSSFGFFF